MFKSVAKIEHKIGDRIYIFSCENDSPLGEVHDALAKFKALVVDMIMKAEQAAKSQETKPTEGG